MITKDISTRLNNVITLNNLSEDHIVKLSELRNNELIETQKEYLKIYKENHSNK